MPQPKHLTQSQVAHLERALDKRNRELREEIRALLLQSDAEHHRDLAGAVADIGDESVANLLADLDAVFIDRHVHDLREVGNARQRLAAGTYGVCAGCGQGIGYERLAVYPTAVRCFACESQREKTYRHEGTPTL
ncbi:MAG TPA: TraR/DksA C4-type zinc finger protein [Burkholderiales bacterium]|jgi:RNA polymerase-binding transcription factor DksA